MITAIKINLPPFITRSFILMFLLFLSVFNDGVGSELKPAPDLKTMIHDWAENFTGKIDSSYFCVTNFKVDGSDENYHVIIHDKNFELSEGLSDEATESFSATTGLYQKIYNGEMTAFTAAARENMSDKTPLNIEFHQPLNSDVLNQKYIFLQRFFNRSANDKIVLEKEKARLVHGAYAIPIFYQTSEKTGVRSAWYLVEKGQQINKKGDTNPFPQYFIIIEGEGYFDNGEEIKKVKKNEAYFIPPGTEHIFKNESEEPLILIFMAWGKGA